MAVKRIGIVLPALGISGGINIVLNWAAILAKSGYHVDIILPQSVDRPEIPFLSEENSRLLHLIDEHRGPSSSLPCRDRDVVGEHRNHRRAERRPLRLVHAGLRGTVPRAELPGPGRLR